MNAIQRTVSVAPMMDYTDRHCRFVHRLFSPHAWLYSEMIVAQAIVRGDADRLLDFDASEHPVALQIGGCDPYELALAARIGVNAGYDEINLNVGCPSDRVRNGSFGACLMANPDLVAECVGRMSDAAGIAVTVKCRIGIDQRTNYEFFAEFVDRVARAGVGTFIVHARNAILKGLSPRQNREIPPLNYEYLYRLKRERNELRVIVNGGIQDCAAARKHLSAGLDGVMLGRAICQRPALLAELECGLIDSRWQTPDPLSVVTRVVDYAREQSKTGVRLHSIARHLHGLFAGGDGARAWRRFLSESASQTNAPAEILYRGLDSLMRSAA